MSSTLSRRNFFRLATDALVTLPSVAGGFLAITPDEALAAEIPYASDIDGGTLYPDEVKAEIIVVNPWEVGFMLVDMADGGESRIPYAHVEVTSRYNREKSVSGTTDEFGTLVLDISELAENDEHKDPMTLDTYAFNGSISITCPGYRDFRVSLTRISGGGGLLVPGRDTNDEKPYPDLVSFDEWDVLYTIESYETYDKSSSAVTVPEFLCFNASPKNDRKHELVVSLRNLAGASTTIRLCERNSGNVLHSQTVTPQDGVATATFAGTFLKTGASDALPLDTDFDVYFVDNGITYSFPIKLRAQKTIFPEPKNVTGKQAKPLANIKNSVGGGSMAAITLPKSFPLGANDLFTMWLPEFPVNVYIDPSGYYQLTVKTPSWGYKNDYGKEDESGWQWFSRSTVSNQVKDKFASWDKLLDKTSSAYDRAGRFKQVAYSRTFTFNGFFQFAAIAQWDPVAKTFQGDAAGQFVLALLFTVTEHFLAGPVPVFIQFDLKSSLTVSLGPGFFVTPKDSEDDWTDVVTDLSRYEWDYTNSGLTFTVLISPSLSVGVGIAGLVSLSLRGNFTLTIFVGVTATSGGNSLPHYIVGYCFRADIVAQFFLWTYAWNVFQDANANWYNSWNTSKLTSQAIDDALNPMVTGSFDDIIDDIKPVSDEMLLASREFDGGEPVGPQADAPEFYLDVEYRDDCVMDDGTVLTSAIYTLKIRGQEEEQTNANAPVDATAQADGTAADEASVAALAAQAETVSEQAEDGAALVAQVEDEGALVAQVEDGAALVAQDEQELSDEMPDGQTLPEDGEPNPTEEGESEDGASLSPTSEEALAANPFAYAIPVNYTPVYDEGEAGQLQAMADSTPGISGIGDHGGIRPTLDTPLAYNVFGDPKIKCVEVDGTVYTLRIGSVTVNNKPVTRLIATVQGGKRIADMGKRQVLDFSINPAIDGFERDELCDIEFAAAPEKYYEPAGMTQVTGWRMHVAIISAKRNTTDFATSTIDLVCSYIVFHHNGDNGFDWIQASTSRKGAEVFTDAPDYPYHSLSNLDISFYTPNSSEHMATVTYLDRMGATPMDVLGHENVKVRVGILFLPFTGYMKSLQLIVPDPAIIEQKMGPITDLSAYELEFWPVVGDVYTFMIRGGEQSYIYILRRDMSNYSDAAINFVKQVGTTAASVRLHAWKIVNDTGGYSPIQTRQFLTCDENDCLCTAQVHEPWSEESASLIFTPQGSENFGIRTFSVWGDFIYWPEIRNGVPGHSYQEDSDELTDMEPVNECRIKASRLRGGHHSDPFVLADIGYAGEDDPGHMIDNIVSLGGDNSAISIIASEFTDKEKDLATIWYLGIPYVKTVTALDATAVIPFVAPGKVAGFFLTLRNDGNTFLSGCEVAMYDKETMYDDSGALLAPAATCNLVFSKDTIHESAWNPKDENGNLTGLEPDDALAPGKTSVYLTEIIIPADWPSGRKEVVFVTRNGTVAGDMVGQDETDGISILEYSIEPGETMMDVLVMGDSEWKAAGFDDSPVTVHGDNPSDGSGGNQGTPDGSRPNGGSGKTGSSASGNKGKTILPQMGDQGVSPGAALLGAGMLAAGAIVGAYENRRAENEQ